VLNKAPVFGGGFSFYRGKGGSVGQ